MKFTFSERQKLRMKQISDSAKHMSKLSSKRRFQIFSDLQQATYDEFMNGERLRNPEMSDAEIIELRKKKVFGE